VSDQSAAVDFYVNKLGFEVRRRLEMSPSADWVEVAPQGAETCLVLYPKSMMQDWPQQKASIVFHCSDTETTIAQLKERGVKIVMEPSDMAWGKFAAIEDPDGNQIGLTEQPIATDPT
jgi:predicted enzyme related to lactoylglutathione lyase